MDRDLAAVALKCLAKEPAARYASAADLAADLERWLAGEPLSVRPATAAEVTRRWVMQNLRVAARFGWSCVGWGVALNLLPFLFVTSVYDPGATLYAAEFPSERPPFLTRLVVAWRTLSPHLWLTVPLWTGFAVLHLGAGLWLTRWFRPRTLAAALGVGLAAGAVSAAVGLFSWVTLVVGNLLLDVNHQRDLTTLGRGEQVAGLAVYPDLATAPPERRRELVAEKLRADLRAGLLPNLWLALAAALGLLTLPTLLQTAAAFVQRRRGERGWLLGLHYAELTLPLFVFLFLLLRDRLNATIFHQARGGRWLLAVYMPLIYGLILWVLWDRSRDWRPARKWLIRGSLGLVLLSVLSNLAELAVDEPRTAEFYALLALLAALGIAGVMRRWPWYVRAGGYVVLVVTLAYVSNPRP